MKYAIIKVNQSYEVKILDVKNDHKEIIESLTNIINKTYKEDNKTSYKVYYEAKDCVSVYYAGYTGKYLECKFYIVPYDEDEFNEL